MRRLPTSNLTQRTADGLVGEFEAREAAHAAGWPGFESFLEAPRSEQAACVAWARARRWVEALEAWERVKESG